MAGAPALQGWTFGSWSCLYYSRSIYRQTDRQTDRQLELRGRVQNVHWVRAFPFAVRCSLYLEAPKGSELRCRLSVGKKGMSAGNFRSNGTRLLKFYEDCPTAER